MLEVESGISPEMIARRGYWTAFTAADIPDGFDEYQYRAGMFPILVIPQWNTVGRLFAYMLRPDNPRRGKDGKLIKYEAQPGAPVGFDVPPAMVPHLRLPHITLYITEGSKKADAMASRGQVCISLSGVYAFLIKRLVVSELDEFGDGRRVRIVFDRDVMTNPNVADALNRIAGAINRRDGRVELVYLPDAGDGKTGVDDYFAAGGTIENLETLCTSWEPVRRPRNMVEYADPYAEIERLKRDNAALVKTLTTPHVKDKHKIAVTRLASISMSKASLGQDVNKRGQVRVSARELTNDWRERKAKGERAEPRNPDGSAFLMDRDSAHGLLKELRDELHVLDFQTVEVKKTRKANGLPYKDREFLITPPASIADVLEPIAQYMPNAPKARPYKRQETCIYCGEVHARKVVCMGCDKTVKVLPVPAANDPNATEEQRRDLAERTTVRAASIDAIAERIDLETGEIFESDPIAGNFPAMETTYKGSPSPAPVNYSAGNFPVMDDEPESVPSKPWGLWDVPFVDDTGPECAEDLTSVGYVTSQLIDESVGSHGGDAGTTEACVDCGTSVPAGRMQPRCGPCIEVAWAQAEADLARDRAKRAARLGVAS